MKNTLYILFAISLVLVTSCTNDWESEMSGGKFSFSTISASMGDLPTSRVHLENGGRVVWDVNDQIGIFSDTQTTPIPFTCTKIDDSKASFSSDDVVSGNDFVAYYPYWNSDIKENILTCEIPRVYSYDDAIKFKNFLVIAKSNTNEFKFKHTCGIIKFSITGTQKLDALYLMGNNGELIAGTGSIDLSKETPIFTIMENADNASKDIVMFGSQLSSTPTEFYCTVPVMDFTQGLSLQIQYYDEAGEFHTVKKTTSKEIKISRSVIKSFSTFDLNDLIEQELEEEKKEKELIYNALMTFYNATGGENWTDNTNWGSDKSFGEWYGLIADDKDVYSINLMSNNLKGYIPEEIGELSNLFQLSLMNNQIGGEIPKSIGDLKKLESLVLIDNQIGGKIPESICNLTKLFQLRLDNNRLTGELPKDIGKMTALQIFDVGTYSVSAGGGSVDFNDTLPQYNQISGEIPISLTTLPNLTHFYANNNKLSGTIPDELWSMPSLTNLTLDGNTLTGTISPAIANAKNLEQLWLRNNHLTGSIPEEICELTKLKELLIGNVNASIGIGDYPIYQYNKFESPIPSNIGKLINLAYLEMSFCGLSGKIPNSLNTMGSLYSLNFQNAGAEWFEMMGDSIFGAQIRELYNRISGSIPRELGQLQQLHGLFLGKNEITGTIPAELSNLTNLQYMHFAENNIEGSIPKEFANLTQLEQLHLYGNRMSGDIPEEITSSPMWSTSVWDPVSWILPQQEGYGFTGYTFEDNDYYKSSDYSSDGKVTVLQKASIGNGIDIILMGDAYSDRLIADGTYDEVMNIAMEKFFSEEPYKSYREMFNVYSVTAVSLNEVYSNGTSTAFSGYFGGGTLVGGNDSKVFEYALKAISEERMDEALIVVMMNSINYAGTCYMYHPGGIYDYGNGVSISYFPVGLDDTSLAQLLHHEACGHGFAKLADEYAYQENGAIPADYATQTKGEQNNWGWWKNIDFTNNWDSIRWNYFINDSRYANEGLGAYEGGFTYWSGVWRPTENSIMRYNTDGFNAPSREAIYYRIHRLAYGADWQYDYEKFVEYDAINRNATAARSFNYVEVPKDYKPLHAPVVMKNSWRNAKNNASKKQAVSRGTNAFEENLQKAYMSTKSSSKPSISVSNYYRTPDGTLRSEIKLQDIKD